MTAATGAATVSQELSPFDEALVASRPATKYPVRGIPHFDVGTQKWHARAPKPATEGLDDSSFQVIVLRLSFKAKLKGLTHSP